MASVLPFRFFPFSENNAVLILTENQSLCFRGKIWVRVISGAIRIWGRILRASPKHIPLLSQFRASSMVIDAVSPDIICGTDPMQQLSLDACAECVEVPLCGCEPEEPPLGSEKEAVDFAIACETSLAAQGIIAHATLFVSCFCDAIQDALYSEAFMDAPRTRRAYEYALNYREQQMEIESKRATKKAQREEEKRLARKKREQERLQEANTDVNVKGKEEKRLTREKREQERLQEAGENANTDADGNADGKREEEKRPTRERKVQEEREREEQGRLQGEGERENANVDVKGEEESGAMDVVDSDPEPADPLASPPLSPLGPSDSDEPLTASLTASPSPLPSQPSSDVEDAPRASPEPPPKGGKAKAAALLAAKKARNEESIWFYEEGCPVPGMFLVRVFSEHVRPQRIPDPWRPAISQTIATLLRNATQPRTERESETCNACLVLGEKGAGKSTLVRYIANALLNYLPRVALIDVDPGQPELSVPGTISLHLLDTQKLLLNPSWMQLMPPHRAYYTGSASPGDDPRRYARAVRCLIRTYVELETESPGLPLIVNTHSWMQGMGAVLLCDLVGTLPAHTHLAILPQAKFPAHPNLVTHPAGKNDQGDSQEGTQERADEVQFEPSESVAYVEPLSYLRDAALPTTNGYRRIPSRHKPVTHFLAMEDAPRQHSYISPLHLRTLRWLAYFRGWTAMSVPRPAPIEFTSSDFAVPTTQTLASRPPWVVPCASLSVSFSRTPPPHLSLLALNASYVGLCTAEQHEAWADELFLSHHREEEIAEKRAGGGEEEQKRKHKKKKEAELEMELGEMRSCPVQFGMERKSGRESMPLSPCLGVGLVRSVDAANKELYLLTPHEGALFDAGNAYPGPPIQRGPSRFAGVTQLQHTPWNAIPSEFFTQHTVGESPYAQHEHESVNMPGGRPMKGRKGLIRMGFVGKRR
eukprot:gnl/Trimastix_PCT/3973.p1 GENE.gnl/Trimastix_PCT/3973~~gnl/Trimastix_PCT/3973.p1  ORF type:complete len:935 (-),score=203.49 gnl/Trimastix_PCT/3973:16-2820(-)